VIDDIGTNVRMFGLSGVVASTDASWRGRRGALAPPGDRLRPLDDKLSGGPSLKAVRALVQRDGMSTSLSD
jgi:uncharacterized protein (DUF1501 family)